MRMLAGTSIAESFAGSIIEFIHDLCDFRLFDGAHVTALREILADETIEFFDATFFP